MFNKKLWEKIKLRKIAAPKKRYLIPLVLTLGILGWERGLEERIYGPKTIYSLEKTDLKRVAEEYPIRYERLQDSEGDHPRMSDDCEHVWGRCYNSFWDTITNGKKILIDKDLGETDRDIIFVHEALHALYPIFSELQIKALENYFIRDAEVMKWSREIRHKYYTKAELENHVDDSNFGRHF